MSIFKKRKDEPTNSIKILELRGMKSVRVYQLYQQTLIALAVYPTTRARDIKEFLSEFETLDIEQKREMLRAAVMLVEYNPDDLKNILDFALVDKTGIELSQQVSAMAPDDIVEAVAEVFLKCSEIRIFFWMGTAPIESPTSQ